MGQSRAGNFPYYKHYTGPEMRHYVPIFFRPGTYDTDKQLHKKITWPMKFGSPDWSLVPMPAKRMLKTEVQKVRTDEGMLFPAQCFQQKKSDDYLNTFALSLVILSCLACWVCSWSSQENEIESVKVFFCQKMPFFFKKKKKLH